MQELVTVLPDSFFGRPPVQLLRATVPESNDVVHVTNKNRVMSEIEQAGLLGSYRHFFFKFVAGLQKLALYSAANRAEPDDKQCKQDESDVVRELSPGDVEV